jgi:hypothetical protein
MSENSGKNGGDDQQENGDKGGDKKVTVNVDTKDRKVKAGEYVVSAFKAEVKVDAAKELEEVINGQLTPLDDNAKIVIRGGETFISHIRRGGSSWK